MVGVKTMTDPMPEKMPEKMPDQMPDQMPEKMTVTNSLYFISGKRTPFGANGGKLKDVDPTELGRIASEAALKEGGVEPGWVDHTIFGSVLSSSAQAIYIPRHIGLKVGIPLDRPALGINRLCGTGFQVVIEAFHQMMAGDTQMALVGGVENMSMAPYVLRKARWGQRLGNGEASDSLMEGLYDSYAQAPMAITAENLAEKYHLNREASDAFALQSQVRTAAAQAAGIFADECVPVGELLSQDEHPRPSSTAESLGKLKPNFKKDGVVTAGNASGIVDGAAALVVANGRAVKEHRLTPIGRLAGYAVVGCDPKIMGIGPAPAIRALLERTQMSLSQIDLLEVNEAFAPQALAVQKELGLDPAKLNVNGGAIAIGHPLAASGTRITLHLLKELRRRKKRWGIGAACIGGGQGIALLLEAL